MGGGGVSGQLHALADLPQGNNPQYKLNRSIGEPWRTYGHFREKKNLLPLPGSNRASWSLQRGQYTSGAILIHQNNRA
jgi:hypothetical protein